MAVVLGFGIAVSRSIGLNHIELGLLFLLAVVSLNFIITKRFFEFKSSLIWVMVFITGSIIGTIDSQNKYSALPDRDFYNSSRDESLEILSIKETDKSIAITGNLILKNGRNSNLHRSSVKAIIYLKKHLYDGSFRAGDLMIANIELTKIKPNPKSEFYNYDQYLLSTGVFLRGFINKNGGYSIDQNYKPSWYKFIRYDARTWASRQLSKYLSPIPNQVAQALVLGEKSYLDRELKSQFASSGIIHILAVSGLHVSFIFGIFYFLLNRIFWRLPPFARPKVSILIVVLLFYAELTGGAPPVWRAVIMSIVFLVGKALYKRTSVLNLLGLAALILMVFDPSQIFSVSFQLSFSAVIGIVVIYPLMADLLELENVFLKRARDIVIVGLSAQLSTFPIALYHFSQVSLVSPLTGLIAIPAAAGILGLGLLLLFSSGFSGILASVVGVVLDELIYGLVWFSSRVGNLKWVVLSDYPLRFIEAGLFGMAIILLVYFFYTRRPQALLLCCCLLLVQAVLHAYFLLQPIVQ